MNNLKLEIKHKVYIITNTIPKMPLINFLFIKLILNKDSKTLTKIYFIIL